MTSLSVVCALVAGASSLLVAPVPSSGQPPRLASYHARLHTTASMGIEEDVQAMAEPSTDLEVEQRKVIEVLMEQARQFELESSKTAMARTMVTLPADISQLRAATAALEAQLADLRPALATLEEEQSALTQQEVSLQNELESTQAELTVQAEKVEKLSARVAELTSATAETRGELTTRAEVLAELASEEAEMEGAYPTLVGELQAVRGEIDATAKRLAKLHAQNDPLSAELEEADGELMSGKKEYDAARLSLTLSRQKLASVRKEREQLAVADAAAQRELAENEELMAGLTEEMDSLKEAAPALFARRTKVQAQLEEVDSTRWS